MSVCCQEMVHSHAGGVIQTVALEAPQPDCLAIYAAFGLGRTVVEGRDLIDQFIVDRTPPHRIVRQNIARKESAVLSTVGGGEEETALVSSEQAKASISVETVETLAKWAMTLERYFKRPQEIEWAVDAQGNSWLVQCRQLSAGRQARREDADICESCANYHILIQDQGAVAHSGVGAGRVYTVHSNDEMEGFPEGAVLVTRYTAPWLALIVPRASAIIAERGSPAGHLATIAREFRVPALVGVRNAIEVLRDGMEITLDTHHRIIYEGLVRELIDYELVQPTVFEESAEFRLLRRLLKRVAPLHLIDPESLDFSPAGCTSVHDLIRYIHENAVRELIDLPSFLQRYKGSKVWTLTSDVPIGLRILDLGEGIDPDLQGTKVSIEHVRSFPLRALWVGVSLPDAWSTEPVHVDLKGLMSSLTRNWDATGTSASATGFNLAVINRYYMNLHLRLGYHFNLIDARMEKEDQHNHIYFRFMGGVTDLTRRTRRAKVLAKILSHYHFNVVVRGDLVVGRLLHLPMEEIQRRLQVLGALIGFTRQLDIQLRNDQDIGDSVERFFDRHSKLAEFLT